MIMKHTTHAVLSTISALLCLLALVSCGGKPVPGGQPQKQKAVARGPLPASTVNGSVMTVALTSALETIDPQTSVYASSFEVINCAMSGLMKMNPDGSTGYDIAVSSKVSPDGLTRTYELRKDVFWANGDPVTAEDFVYGWQRAVDPEIGSEYGYMIYEIAQIKNGLAVATGKMDKQMLGVKALDPYTLEVQLLAPVPFFDQLLYFCTFFPANQKFVEQCGENYGMSADTFLSCGPFVLTEFTANEETDIVLIKNTAHYDAKNVTLGGLRHKFYTAAQDEIDDFEAGKLDLFVLPSSKVNEYTSRPEFKSVAKGFMYYMSVNMTKPALQNVHLRRALNLAIDREAICAYLNNGSLPSYTPVPSGYAFSSSGKDFTPVSVEFPNDCAYNPELARKEFAMALAETGKTSMSVELSVIEGSSQAKMAQNIKEQVERDVPGLTIELKQLTGTTIRRVLASGDYELGMTNWGPDYADAMTYLSMWSTGNSQNTGSYNNPQFNALIADCTSGELATKETERWNAMKEAEKILIQEAGVMPLYMQCDGDMIQKGVTGIEFHAVAVNRIFNHVKK